MTTRDKTKKKRPLSEDDQKRLSMAAFWGGEAIRLLSSMPVQLRPHGAYEVIDGFKKALL